VINKTADRGSASASQVKWTDSDVPITHQNVDIVLNATLSASQSMNNLLVALRDELRKITAGKHSEHERQLKQEQVALKLRRSLLTFQTFVHGN
jgi:protein subunit release factor A